MACAGPACGVPGGASGNLYSGTKNQMQSVAIENVHDCKKVLRGFRMRPFFASDE
jgi:hypothetical protein